MTMSVERKKIENYQRKRIINKQPAQSANLDRLQECNVCGCHKLRNNSKLKSQLSQAYYPKSKYLAKVHGKIK